MLAIKLNIRYKVDNYIGKTKKEIKNTSFYNYVYYGDGDTVIYQSPDYGERIKEGDTIMLYMGWSNIILFSYPQNMYYLLKYIL